MRDKIIAEHLCLESRALIDKLNTNLIQLDIDCRDWNKVSKRLKLILSDKYWSI